MIGLPRDLPGTEAIQLYLHVLTHMQWMFLRSKSLTNSGVLHHEIF